MVNLFVLHLGYVFCCSSLSCLSDHATGSVTEQIMLLENIGTSVLVSKNQVSEYLTKFDEAKVIA